MAINLFDSVSSFSSSPNKSFLSFFTHFETDWNFVLVSKQKENYECNPLPCNFMMNKKTARHNQRIPFAKNKLEIKQYYFGSTNFDNIED